ncbi:MAG: methyltransferase domain-containing protein [Rhodospirillales bacterium]|nr:methyltransferase domain-containing protein [Rhodospirillales bacterium]
MKKFLHVGCGPNYKDHTTSGFASDDWQEVRLDIDPSVKPDIIASSTDLSIVPSESFNALFSSHNIEHVFAHEVATMLGEFLRVLNSDGYFIVNCPNLLPIAQLIIEDKLTEAAYVSPAGPITPMDMLFGHGAAIADGNEYMAHKCGFTPKSLQEALLAAGFKGVAMIARDTNFDIWAVATKQERSREELTEIVNLHLPVKIPV